MTETILSVDNKPLRVAIISSGFDTYGVRRNIISTLKAFKRLSVEAVYIPLMDGPMAQEALDCGAEVIKADVGRGEEYSGLLNTFKNFSRSFKKAKDLAAIFKKAGVDRVIVRTPRDLPLVAKACWHAKIPGFWLMPNLISSRYPLRLNAWIYEFMLAGFGMTAIANSAYTRSTLIGRLKKSYYSHLGIDPDDFAPQRHPSADRSQFGFGPDDDVFGIFARITPEKGQREFIQGFSEATKDFPSARLLICGGPLESDYAQHLQKMVANLGLTGKVYFSGPSDRLGVSIGSLYAMCDVIVNSRIDPEPFGLSVIEGMLMKKPLLVHALGGPAETVRNEQDGWHMTSGTAEAFAKGIKRALGERDRWVAYGENARNHALSEFTHVAAAKRILTIMNAGGYQ